MDDSKDKSVPISNTAAESAKVLLISLKAGNVGINLVGANRVILFDSSWNPTMDDQALHRCYRYGQTKPVYVYRLLTEGTMEEKVYSRSVNKTNLASRVIDNKDPQRNFTKGELEDVMKLCSWVKCDSCEKWRMFPPDVDVEDLPDTWYCHLNIHDEARSNCNAEQRTQQFYEKFFSQSSATTTAEGMKHVEEEHTIESEPLEEKDRGEICAKTKRDIILEQLLKSMPSSTDKNNDDQLKSSTNAGIISKYYFHDSLVQDSN